MSPDFTPGSTPDWSAIAGWAGGAAFVVGVVVAAIIKGVQRAAEIARSIPPEKPTKIITADTSAMNALAGTIDKATETVAEASAHLKELVGIGQEWARRMREEQEVDVLDDRIDKLLDTKLQRLEDEIKRQRRRAGPRKPPGT